jgi:hypothetical protein
VKFTTISTAPYKKSEVKEFRLYLFWGSQIQGRIHEVQYAIAGLVKFISNQTLPQLRQKRIDARRNLVNNYN